jgi:hypothetical protein
MALASIGCENMEVNCFAVMKGAMDGVLWAPYKNPQVAISA